jgi:hypothetical protein
VNKKVKYVFILIAVLMGSVFLHECGHYLAGLIFYHVSGKILFFQGWLIGGYLPDYDVGVLARLGGGLFAGIILISLVLFKVPQYFKAILVFVGFSQIFTGINEGFLPMYYGNQIAGIIISVLSIIVLAIYILRQTPKMVVGVK